MKTIVPAAALLVLTSCATMVNGRYQDVKVDSYPAGAAIAVDCGKASHDGGTTPTTLRLPRRAEACTLKLSKAGYREREFVFERQLSRAVSANTVAAAPVAVVTAVAGAIVASELALSDDVIGFGWDVGLTLGSAPGRQIDKQTGGAYKWVPGDVFIVLYRERSLD